MRLNEIEEKIKWQSIVKRDCKPYLKERGQVLYRGMDTASNKPIKKQVRLDNRSPAGSTVEVHAILNTYFDTMFGHPFRNGLFVSGKENDVRLYGEIHIIFPIGDFDFLWSPVVSDLYGDADWNEDETDAKVISNEVHQNKYQTTDLKAATKSGNEIMIWCKEYYAIPYSIYRANPL